MTAQPDPYPAHKFSALPVPGSSHGFGVELCRNCGMSNRVDAKLCRSCRASLALEDLSAGAGAGPVDVLHLPGDFRRGPVKAGGLLYLLSITGTVYQLAPRGGAELRPMAQLRDASAGFNRFAVLDIPPLSRPGGLRGWTLLAAGVQGVNAVSLATGEATRLFSPAASEQMAVNRSDLDGTGFKGLAATPELCACVTYTGPDRFTLNLIPLTADRPTEQPLTLHGNVMAGAALCGESFVFCTEAQVGRFHVPSRKAQSMNLPAGFKPLVSPSSTELTVALGGMPFLAQTNARGGELLLVAGMQGDRSGVLRIDFDRNETEFRLLPRGSALATGAGGSATLRTRDGIELAGSRTGSVAMRTQSGMPAFEDGTTLFTFSESDFARKHDMIASGPAGKVNLWFEDERCDRYSCCGAYALARGFAVTYLHVDTRNGMEMLLAYWPAAGGVVHA